MNTYHRPPRKNKKYYPLIILSLIITACTIIILILVVQLKNISNKPQKSYQTSVVKSFKPRKVVSKLKSSNSTTSSTKPYVPSKTQSSVNSKINPNKTPTSVEVTNISKYAKLNGEYFENNNNQSTPAILDFNQQILKIIPAPAVPLTIYTFKKVLLHPDGSIVINVNNPNVGDSIKNFSILLAPAGVAIKQNWQTGEQINDITDKNFNRFSLGNSINGGKTFKMDTAYNLFSDDNSDHYQSTIYYAKSK